LVIERRAVHDRYLPIDHEAFIAAEPPTGRVIVIAPTRAACETIELALGLTIETFLQRTQGEALHRLATSGRGFGIVAGTGTGKTLAVRPIAQAILRTDTLRVGVINREREATPETPSWNVIIVTTGIARRWFQDGDILPQDTLVVDEIHQTSAELELCLALGKRTGCRFIWLSATVDPSFYARYLNSADVLQVSAFDPAKAAQVEVVRKVPTEFLDDGFLKRAARESRGVAMFLPTRAMVEDAAAWVASRFPRMASAHYHGGEPIRVIRPFLEGTIPKPFFIAMTAAGQSALNVPGLDTVIIDDSRFTNVISRGRNVLTRTHLGANEILQMAGRVHGRVSGGRVFILSDRDLHFGALRPTEPEFQLAGDSERVALTCAGLGVRADDLELPVPLDRAAYRRALALLESRGLIDGGRLTDYGRAVEALPVERPWAELIVHGDDTLLPCLAVMSGIDSLHRMTRDDRDLKGLVVHGSDHLTAYNVYADAFREAGYVGEVYGLARHMFDPERIAVWAERRGVLVKALRMRHWRWRVSTGASPSHYRESSRWRATARNSSSRSCWQTSCPSISSLTRRPWTVNQRAYRVRVCAGAGGPWLDHSATSPTALGCRARASRGRSYPTNWCERTPWNIRRSWRSMQSVGIRRSSCSNGSPFTALSCHANRNRCGSGMVPWRTVR
jgi:ATP-dependent helicase HrpA